MTISSKLFVPVMLMACAGSASAQVSWTLTGGSFNAPNSATSYTVGTPVGGTSLNLSAFANTGGTGTPDNQTIELQVGATQTTSWSTTGSRRIGINDYGGGGVGIVNRDGCGFTTNGLSGGASLNSETTNCDASEAGAPEHAFDNNQRYEMALLTFGQKVNLTSLTLGYVSGDLDFTVMAYAPTAQSGLPAAPSIVGKTWSQLGAANSGWQAVSFISDTVTTGVKSFTTAATSSYWLIGAYNPLANPGASGYTNGNDYIKISAVTGTVVTQQQGQTPEPGSMALFGIAAFGMMALRRRKKR